MAVASSVESKYAVVRPHLDVLAGIVNADLMSFCAARGFAYLPRLKDVDSVSEKLETGRFSKWSALDDLFACSVVIPSLRDEAVVLAFLAQTFDTVATKARGDAWKAPDVFRFEATRFIGRLRSLPGHERSAVVASSLFEVQVRTAFEHAWSTTTHGLVYKSPQVEWKRLRLAAQLKAVVEQLDMLVLGFDTAADLVPMSEWPDVAMRTEIVALLRDGIKAGSIPTHLSPRDWSRFGESALALMQSTSQRKYGKGRERRKNVHAASMEALAAAIARAATEPVPESVTLHQWTLGTLWRAGVLEEPLMRGPDAPFHPLVTPQLLSFFPELSAVAHRFDIDG
jgi:ppGpp synthetase/RelA/SpoT-type nucleotidyltranferase